MVKQIRGQYRVKNPTLLDLYQRAKKMIAELEWFSIQHTLREGNQEADRLANLAMDKGMGRRSTVSGPVTSAARGQELNGVVRGGVIVLEDGKLPEGTRVQIRVRE